MKMAAVANAHIRESAMRDLVSFSAANRLAIRNLVDKPGGKYQWHFPRKAAIFLLRISNPNRKTKYAAVCKDSNNGNESVPNKKNMICDVVILLNAGKLDATPPPEIATLLCSVRHIACQRFTRGGGVG